MEPHAHVGGPGDGTDVDNVPASLSVIHIDSHKRVISCASVLKDVITSVGITVNNTESLVGLSDIGMLTWKSEKAIASVLVRLEIFVSLGVGSCELDGFGAESAPVVSISSNGTFVSEPRVRCIWWQVLGSKTMSEFRHGDRKGQVIRVFNTIADVVSNIDIAFLHKVQEGLEAKEVVEVVLVVRGRLDDDFLALVHSSVDEIVTSLDAV